ncbi:hypothetical protein PZE06_18625 [Robertmurraya sp. DFI.2.37]|uniref:hypothetical protein n=1 Tax=Robertmurraya sp. DFI.2.37 TaxID=3031819 RepID=UPI0023DC7190|nr:hypothetical protein [Robertmurraya sp. DFI.2.37]MDF1510152.1 hypothetical protein [Robertmurraya sp. DFI.2.37]
MTAVEGILSIRRIKGSDIMLLNDTPLVKSLSHFNDKEITVTIKCENDRAQIFSGVAEIFYFEGQQQYHRGIKYVSDFFIDDVDIMEWLERLEGKYIKLIVK